MSIIYEPKGKAKEYSDLAANYYKGCSHGCVYCWAPSATFKDRDNFHKNPTARKGAIEKLYGEAQKLYSNGHRSTVLLCFTCDPYQPIDEELKLTRRAIIDINDGGLPVQILTKGGERSIRDFDILSQNPDNRYAASLTLLDKNQSLTWEPGAAVPAERIETLRLAFEAGLKTWVSFEPVLNPEDVYKMIDLTHEFVNLFKVGKLNYHPLAGQIDWKKFKNTVIKKLKHYNKNYYIKKDLAKF